MEDNSKRDDNYVVKLTGALQSFPAEVFKLSSTLKQLDLSGTGLSSLPAGFGKGLPFLEILFLSSCAFTTFPLLADCPRLEMVAFRRNGMTDIPENAFPPRLRWLILTDNKIESLPSSIGDCQRLQKCMLAGNRLRDLPEAMQNCKKLGLLRLSSNKLRQLPEWLLTMPELAFLSFAGNPCLKTGSLLIGENAGHLPCVPWKSLEIGHVLGQGASGVIFQARWQKSNADGTAVWLDVAVKTFKGDLTSDGTPEDEMAAVISAGQHENIINVLGRVVDHPDETTGNFKGAVVMELIPPDFLPLGGSPSMQSVTRDCFEPSLKLPHVIGFEILANIAAATQHLVLKGITHGDLYAHNILYDQKGHALLGDFGAATCVGNKWLAAKLEKLEILAFGHLIEDILGLLSSTKKPSFGLMGEGKLRELHSQCVSPEVETRITFIEVSARLRSIKDSHILSRLSNQSF